jgi:hypothetical protein
MKSRKAGRQVLCRSHAREGAPGRAIGLVKTNAGTSCLSRSYFRGNNADQNVTRRSPHSGTMIGRPTKRRSFSRLPYNPAIP